MAEDIQERLHWLEDALRAEEPEQPAVWEDQEPDDLGPGYNYAQDFDRAMYQGVDYHTGEQKPKKKGRLLPALLKILGILAMLGWWLEWLP